MHYVFSRYHLIFSMILISLIAVSAHSVEPTILSLSGQIGVSSEYGSGWLILDSPLDLVKGDTLRIRVGGTAQKILLRLLPKGHSPDSTDGIIGSALTVPKDRIINIKLDSPHSSIIQISVHGGPNPWDKYSLGGSNGPANLQSAELIRQ